MEDATAAVAAGNRFAMELYGRLASRTEGNLFFSPLGVHVALGAMLVGARGDTAGQMADVLGVSGGAESFAAVLANIRAADAPEPAPDAPSGELSIATAVWAAQKYPFRSEYLRSLAESFQAEAHLLDFAAAQEACEAINGWVSRQTRGRISRIVDPAAIHKLARLVLTNAVYFRSAWRSPFEESATKAEPFRCAGGPAVTAPMMHQRTECGFKQAGDHSAIALPYADRQAEMVVYLPAGDDGLAAFERAFPAAAEDLLGGFAHEDVILALPRFRLSQERRLSEVLSAMGMPDAFREDLADFSGVTRAERVFLSEVLHSTFVTVDEAGTEAAAATAVMLAGAAPHQRPPRRFTADHPFVFVIRHRVTDQILFMGRVADPRE